MSSVPEGAVAGEGDGPSGYDGPLSMDTYRSTARGVLVAGLRVQPTSASK
jgi:hypothetical protein